jgi:uncharacterized protein
MVWYDQKQRKKVEIKLLSRATGVTKMRRASNFTGSIMNRKLEKARRLILQEKPDKKTAYEIVARLAAADYAPAQYALATWYLHGFDNIVKINIKKGIALLRKASGKNEPNACYNLAISYELGKGVKKSISKAVQYYTKSALLGEVDAMDQLTRIYYYGHGVEKNRLLARVWNEHAHSFDKIAKKSRNPST